MHVRLYIGVAKTFHGHKVAILQWPEK